MEEVIMEPQIGLEGDDPMIQMDLEPFPDEKEPNLPENNVKGEELELALSERETTLEPFEGMEFETEEAARAFYSAYARRVGFRIRISRYTRSRRDNSIISRLIVCSKEGFRESRSTDGTFSERRQQRQRAVTRVGCKAMLMVKKIAPGKWVVSKFVKEHNHGPVPPRKVEVRLVCKEEDSVKKLNLSSDGGVIHEPFEGMEFDSEEDARSFYISYARQMGFRARISKYCRSRRDNSIISRQIVCSKEGFREVRVKKEETDEGRVKRPRVITRIGCKAMIIVKKLSSGKWVVSRFEKEHNHALGSSKKVPRLLQSSPESTEKGLFTYLGGANVVSNAKVIMSSGCCGGVEGASRESLTVLYNHLCYEAIKYAQEGAVSEHIYNVAMSALKEAVEKVAAAKRTGVTVAQPGLNASQENNSTDQTKSLDGVQCSGAVPGQELVVMQQPVKFVLIPSTSLSNDSKAANFSAESPLFLNISNGQGMNMTNPVPVLKQPSASAESAGVIVGNGITEQEHDSTVQKPQNLDYVGASQAKSTPGSGSNLCSGGTSEAQMVAIPALTLYMPIMGSLSESSSVALPGTPGSNGFAFVAAPMEAVAASSRSSSEPGMQSQVSRQQSAATAADQSHRSYTGPNPLVHATAVAAGARVVPPQEAASLIKAIEARVRSAKSAVVSGHKQCSVVEAWSPRSCNSSDEGRKALGAARTNGEGINGQEAAAISEMRVHGSAEGLKEMEVGMMGHCVVYDDACDDDTLFSDGCN